MHGSTHTLGCPLADVRWRTAGHRIAAAGGSARTSRHGQPESARGDCGCLGRGFARKAHAPFEHALFAATLAALACLDFGALALVAIAR